MPNAIQQPTLRKSVVDIPSFMTAIVGTVRILEKDLCRFKDLRYVTPAKVNKQNLLKDQGHKVQ